MSVVVGERFDSCFSPRSDRVHLVISNELVQRSLHDVCHLSAERGKTGHFGRGTLAARQLLFLLSVIQEVLHVCTRKVKTLVFAVHPGQFDVRLFGRSGSPSTVHAMQEEALVW